MEIKHPQIGICGLSCVLCPRYHTEAKSRCYGCKSKNRMDAGCPFITCAQKRDLEFCWDCPSSHNCEQWKKHRERSKKYDSFVCYQKLEENISYVQDNDVDAFIEQQKKKEELLKQMLVEFNEGRSKSFYCVIATVMKIETMDTVIKQARKSTKGLNIKEKSRVLHHLFNEVAKAQNDHIQLRKPYKKE